jgi:hypothetical protein
LILFVTLNLLYWALTTNNLVDKTAGVINNVADNTQKALTNVVGSADHTISNTTQNIGDFLSNLGWPLGIAGVAAAFVILKK